MNCEFIIISSSIGNSALISNSIISTSINTIIYIIIASITITIIIISLSSSSPSPSSPPSSPPPSSSIQYDHHLHTGGSQHRGIRVLLSSMFCTGSIVNLALFLSSFSCSFWSILFDMLFIKYQGSCSPMLQQNLFYFRNYLGVDEFLGQASIPLKVTLRENSIEYSSFNL